MINRVSEKIKECLELSLLIQTMPDSNQKNIAKSYFEQLKVEEDKEAVMLIRATEGLPKPFEYPSDTVLVAVLNPDVNMALNKGCYPDKNTPQYYKFEFRKYYDEGTKKELWRFVGIQ